MNITNRLSDLGLRIERARARAKVLSELAEALEEERRLVERQRDLWVKDHELARDLDVAGSTNPNLRPSNVQVYEDVLIANGSPMHVSRILDAALLRGVELKGDRSEVDQVRNALARSNRFHNVGANTWWIGQSPVREEATPSAAAVSSAETPCLEGAGDAPASQLSGFSGGVAG